MIKRLFENPMVRVGLALVAGVFLGMTLFGGGEEAEHAHEDAGGTDTVWTCSMHPQIRQSEPGQCPICGMDLIPLTGQQKSGMQASPFVYAMSPQAAALADVQTTTVGYELPTAEVYLTGKVAVNEQKRAVITADYAGRIESLLVDFTGQQVRKGQRLATIYSPDLITAQKELLEAAKNKAANAVLYRAAREKLRLWKVSERQIDAVEASGEIHTEFDVYAHMSGVVLARKVSTGDYVKRGSVLFEIADLSTVWVLLDAYESDLPWVREGNAVDFAVASIPGRDFRSTVTFVDPLLHPQTRTASVRAEAPNPGLMLKPDMFVQARLKSVKGVEEKALLIPKSALLWTGQRSVVYVKMTDMDLPTFEMREVDLGPRAGNAYVVTEGVMAGEEVVTDGVFAVDAAAQLSGNYSMMNRPVSKRIRVPERFMQQVTMLAHPYFDLKNALVAGDRQRSHASATAFLTALKDVEMKGLDGKAHEAWMAIRGDLLQAVGAIDGAADIDALRRAFAPLSDAMIELVEVFGLAIETVYVDYCPMAFNNKGAHWLSEFEDIANPYFGDAMHRCGEVRKAVRMDEPTQKSTSNPMIGHPH